MTVYVETLKESTINLPKLTAIIARSIGHKANIQKPIVFLYPSNEHMEFDIKIITPLTKNTLVKI